MEKSSTDILEEAFLRDDPDRLSMKRWLVVYAAYLLALVVSGAILLERLEGPWRAFFLRPGDFTTPDEQALKLLIFAIYVSAACTFLPLPTGWLVAALATRDVALSQNVFLTTFLVASIGAAGSMVANVHDYHLFTWMLRHHRIARIRTSKVYQRAARWFDRRPFALLVIFNVLPIPIDLVRMLSATCRYPLRQFVAANFIGRWIRYAVLAFVTFQLGPHGPTAVITLLVGTILFGLVKLFRRIRPSGDEVGKPPDASDKMVCAKETTR